MKRLLPFFALAVMLSACVKPDNPDEHSTIRFSVLGDSFSAFEGMVDPETNDVYPYEGIGVTSAEQMWWHKVATEMDWVMERNNSFSGALVCNFDGFSSGSYYAPNSYLLRMDNLGNPDVIFVFGATNDIYQRAPLGDFIYSDWTEEQLCTFRPGLAYLFNGLKRMYPHAEIYCLVDMELCINDTAIDDETRQAFIESMHRISSHYNVQCIDLYAIHKSHWHPDAIGQEGIANQVLDYLGASVN